MAIYHCSVRTFSRADGHSAVAAAAYRSGSKLYDERTGITHRYERRNGVSSAFILLPKNVSQDYSVRTNLWNAAESADNRKNSRTAREIVLALPHELTDQQRHSLTSDMANWLLQRYSVGVDVAIHTPCNGHDARNHHAHLLFTTRELTSSGFGAKTRMLDDKAQGPKEIEIIREVWETLANDALSSAGFEDIKIDRRTLNDQGIDRIPQTHEGKASRNASKAKSLLADHFERLEQEDGGDESDDGSGESSSSSSSSGDSGKPITVKSTVREDSKAHEIDYTKIDNRRTRTDFVDEIKALNQQRAAYSTAPLTYQIAQFDELIARLDQRVARIYDLEQRAGLPKLFARKFLNMRGILIDILSFKKTVWDHFKDKSEAKTARYERQMKRYGRSYKQGLHMRIQEMKDNIQILEVKKKHYLQYKAFVDRLEHDVTLVKNSSSGVSSSDSSRFPSKIRTPQEVSLKLRLRAQMIRPHIPKDFLPKEAKQSLKGTLPRMHAPQPLRLETGIPVKVSSARVIQGKPLKLPADIKTRRQSVREISHQSRSKARIYIPTARLPLTAHKAPKLRRSLSSRTIWFKEKTARIAPLQMKIRDGLKSHRVPGLKTSRAAQSFKVDKAVSYKVYKTKLRTSAKEVHKLIPIRYRASSYRMPLPDDIKPKKDHYPLSDSVQSLKASVDKSWKAVKEIKEASGEVLTKPPKPVKMSKVFNVSNGLKTTKPLKVSLDLKPKI